MSYNGSGLFNINSAGQPVVSGTTIDPTVFNALTADLATGLSTAICKDGQTTVTANIPMGANKITGLAAATARTDATNLGNIQDCTGVYVGTVGGTADVITLTPSPAISSYTAGQTFRFIASGVNTTNVTVNVSSLGAKAITKNGTTALAAGDIPSAMMVQITYDGTRFILGSAATSTINSPTIVTPVLSGTATGTYTMAGTGTYTSPTINTGTVGAVAKVALGIPANSQLTKALYGLTYANSAGDATNDIDFAAGGAIDATGAYWMVGSALTKQLDAAWAVGNNAGMLDTGAVGNNDYYLWLIARSDTGVVDYLASLSSTAPTMPAAGAYDYKRLIGWIKRTAGTNVAFTTYETEGGGLEFLWTSPTVDVDLANTLTTSRRTDAVKVPLNFSVTAHLNVRLTDVTGGFAWVYCPDQSDLAPSPTAAPLANMGYEVAGADVLRQLFIRTSSTGTIAARATVTQDSYKVATLGFTWARRN